MDSDCYCIVLRAATRKVTAIYDAALEPVGVNIAQFSLLRKIDAANTVSLTELARRADLDRSTIGRNVKLLARLGLVTLGPGDDQREAVVSVAAAGYQVLEEGAPLWDQAQEKIESALGPDTAHRLRGLLQTL